MNTLASNILPKTAVIETNSGRMIDILNPDPSQIDIWDIAHGLSKTCRFSGQCDGFRTVAEHSIAVSDFLKNHGEDTSMQLLGLLHDSSEAFICDVPTPIKNLLPVYKHIESKLMNAILDAFGFDYSFDNLPDELHYADRRIGRIEAHFLMVSEGKHWPNHAPLTLDELASYRPKLYTEELAQEIFLMRFDSLTVNS